MTDSFLTLAGGKLSYSILIVTTLLLIRSVLLRYIKKHPKIVHEQQRRWISHLKNGIFTTVAVILLLFWWPELREFGLSIAAVAVALVIALKELLLCISGAILRTAGGNASIGDWIEIEDLRGEVIEKNIMSTVLQEVENKGNSYSYTGKTIVLPNSVFLSHTVKNMNFMRRFVFHSFSLVTQPTINVFEMKSKILDRIEFYSEEFHELGARYHAFIMQLSGIELPSPCPSVRVTTTNLGKNVFTVTLFCPTPKAVSLEQKITEEFFDLYYKKLQLEAAANFVDDD